MNGPARLCQWPLPTTGFDIHPPWIGLVQLCSGVVTGMVLVVFSDVSNCSLFSVQFHGPIPNISSHQEIVGNLTNMLCSQGQFILQQGCRVGRESALEPNI